MIMDPIPTYALIDALDTSTTNSARGGVVEVQWWLLVPA